MRLILAVLLTALNLFAPAQTNNSKADELIKICEGLLAVSDGKQETFNRLISNGVDGLTITDGKDDKRRCLLNKFAGIGYYNKHRFDSASFYFEHSYDHSIKAKMGNDGAYSLGALVSIYHYMQVDHKSDSAAKLLQAILDTSHNNTTKSNGYYALGTHHFRVKNFYTIALDDFLQSLAFAKIAADTSSIPKHKLNYATVSMSIADIYIGLKQPAKAIQYLVEGNKYASLSVRTEIANYCRFVKCYAALKNIDSALFYQNLLETAAAKSPSIWPELITANLALGYYYLDKNEPSAAKKFIDTAAGYAAATKADMMISQTDAIQGRYYLQTGNNVEAKKYFLNSIDKIYNIDREGYCDMRKGLAEIAVEEGNAEEAKKQLNLYTQANDSLANEKISNNLAEMEAKFQNKDKQLQIETKNIQLVAAGKQRVWLMIGLGLLGVVAILSVIFYRFKKRTADVLDEKNKDLAKLNTDLDVANRNKAKLFSIISHDLRSPISQVYQFLNLQQLNPNLLSPEQKTTFNQKIQTATGSLLETMEDLLLWSKTQMNQFNTTMQHAPLEPVVLQVLGLVQLSRESKNLTIENDVSTNAIVFTDPSFLQTIIRNLLQNAIKASPQGGQIKIAHAILNSRPAITIQNEGPSFTQKDFEQLLADDDSNKGLSGLGLRLVQELAEKIHAQIFFGKDEKQSGSIVTILFPQSAT